MSARIQLVRAPNPSAMTLDGTNSYILDGGDGRAVCIDPGPAIDRHVGALIKAARSRNARVDKILVTHGHPDHWPAARALAEASGARVYAHPAAEFAHDGVLRDGERVIVGDLDIIAVHAPGHTFDHLVFYESLERALFTGDVILGTGTVVIAPPGGAMRPYQQTLQRLADEFPAARRIYGGHGPAVENPREKIRNYIAHRQLREVELLGALSHGTQTIPDLVRGIYADVDEILWPAAARQMLAYLIALEQEGRVRSAALERALTPEENAILNPSWRAIVGEEQAALVEAELGGMLHLDAVRVYTVT